MNESEYEQMYNLESYYWWFVARRKLVRDFVRDCKRPQPGVLLDVGCGTGLNCLMLSEFGSVKGTDRSEQALEFGRRRGIADLTQSDAEHLQFPDSTFDVLTALDVLEHVDDDLKALSEMYRVMKPGAWLIITVPAYGFLWKSTTRPFTTADDIPLTSCGTRSPMQASPWNAPRTSSLRSSSPFCCFASSTT